MAADNRVATNQAHPLVGHDVAASDELLELGTLPGGLDLASVVTRTTPVVS